MKTKYLIKLKTKNFNSLTSQVLFIINNEELDNKRITLNTITYVIFICMPRNPIKVITRMANRVPGEIKLNIFTKSVKITVYLGAKLKPCSENRK